ncbi:hypothetical protein BDY24DRAFT_129972 [Mrakia frigida]|uniref:J domain-containing protein n=1 Tax=Mrakia frigida TaxID=29902 RepID=UPI003FCBF50E
MSKSSPPPDAGPSSSYAMIEKINASNDLYEILGCSKYKSDSKEMRKLFLHRARNVHPDKFPSFPPATSAFQKLSLAFRILSDPASKRLYDASPSTSSGSRTSFPSSFWSHDGGFEGGSSAGDLRAADETLNGVLFQVWTEFIEGDFHMIRVVINAINETNSGLNLGNDTVETLEGALRRLRSLLLGGQKYAGVIRFELIRLYEIQQNLRALRWLDLGGRLRLTLQLTRVVVSIPLQIDKALKDEAETELVAERKRLANPKPPPETTSPSPRRPKEPQTISQGPESWTAPTEPEIAASRAGAGLLNSKLEMTLKMTAAVLESGEGWLGGGGKQETLVN